VTLVIISKPLSKHLFLGLQDLHRVAETYVKDTSGTTGWRGAMPTWIREWRKHRVLWNYWYIFDFI